MNKADLHILMLEDEPADAEFNVAQLALLEEYNCIVNIVTEKNAYLDALENTSPDIVLSDFVLPQYNGLEALFDLKKKGKLIPFIFVTGAMNEETVAETIKSGAWDYIVKDRLSRLPIAVRGALQLKEERLIASKAEEKVTRLLTAIDQTSTQIIVFSLNGIIEYVNKKFSEITGLSSEEIIGRDAISLSKDGYNLGYQSETLEKIMNGEVYHGEKLSRRKDNSSIWELISVSPIKNEAGEIMSFVAVKEDITQRKLMEQEIIEAHDKAERSDKLKDAFLQNMSHEIRTPLNSVVGFSNLLNADSNYSEERIKEFTSIIHDSSLQLLSIVTDVLTIASIQSGQETVTIKPTNINKLFNHLEEIFKPSAIEKNLELSFSIAPADSPVLITTDETKLNQILTNLLNNALKFTKSGSIEVTQTIIDNTICFSVKDTGIGISKEFQRVIFERFRQAEESIHIEYGGTGLGLSISKSFAQMLGGTLRVESEPGRGSIFTLSIPYASGVFQPTQKKPSLVLATDRMITILVAEDEINNFHLIKALLYNQKTIIVHARNGYEAVRICEEDPEIDLVLMDIKMPVMNGIVAFERIRAFRKDLPIIAQTAYGLEREKLQLLEIGFNEYVSKPIDKDCLLETIKKCLKY
jgi:PAS domain S-box-containing protein